MTSVLWILRGILLLWMMPVLFPVSTLRTIAVITPIGLALSALAVALLALALVFAVLLGVLGRLFDVLIYLFLFGLLLEFPYGDARESFLRRLAIAHRRLRRVVSDRLGRSTLVEYGICLAVTLIALALSVSIGLLHLLGMVLVVLLLAGVIWKWPHQTRLPRWKKLTIAMRALFEEIRRRFR